MELKKSASTAKKSSVAWWPALDGGCRQEGRVLGGPHLEDSWKRHSIREHRGAHCGPFGNQSGPIGGSFWGPFGDHLRPYGEAEQ